MPSANKYQPWVITFTGRSLQSSDGGQVCPSVFADPNRLLHPLRLATSAKDISCELRSSTPTMAGVFYSYRTPLQLTQRNKWRTWRWGKSPTLTTRVNHPLSGVSANTRSNIDDNKHLSYLRIRIELGCVYYAQIQALLNWYPSFFYYLSY